MFAGSAGLPVSAQKDGGAPRHLLPPAHQPGQERRQPDPVAWPEEPGGLPVQGLPAGAEAGGRSPWLPPAVSSSRVQLPNLRPVPDTGRVSECTARDGAAADGQAPAAGVQAGSSGGL